MKKLLFGLLLFCAPISYGALPTLLQWDISTTGNNLNGGGFNTGGGSGTDYSQQDSSQTFSTNCGCVRGSSAITTTDGFYTASMIHNLINISSNSSTMNFATGYYEITAFQTSTAVTVDRDACPSANGVNANGGVGGRLLNISSATVSAVAGNTVWIKNGVYLTATVAGGVNLVTMNIGAIGKPITLAGYNSTHGDLDLIPGVLGNYANQPLMISSNTTIMPINGAAFNTFKNITCLTVGVNKPNRAFSSNVADTFVINCKAMGAYTSSAFFGGGTTYVADFSSGAVLGYQSNAACNYYYCGASTYTTAGFQENVAARNTYDHCFAFNGAGTTSDGFDINSGGAYMNHVISYNNPRDGVRGTGAGSFDNTSIGNSFFGKNNGAGINSITTVYTNQAWMNANGFFGNGVNYTNLPTGNNDILTPLDPFVDGVNGNFSLTTAATGGTLLKQKGFPNTVPVFLTPSYEDIGMIQNQNFPVNTFYNSTLINTVIQ